MAKPFDAATDQDLTPIPAFVPFANFLLWWQISQAAGTVIDRCAKGSNVRTCYPMA
jgi:hypothetical protein